MSFFGECEYTFLMSSIKKNKELFKAILEDHMTFIISDIDIFIDSLERFPVDRLIYDVEPLEYEYVSRPVIIKGNEEVVKFIIPEVRGGEDLDLEKILEDNKIPFDFYSSQTENESPVVKYFRPNENRPKETFVGGILTEPYILVSELKKLLDENQDLEAFREKIIEKIRDMKPIKPLVE